MSVNNLEHSIEIGHFIAQQIQQSIQYLFFKIQHCYWNFFVSVESDLKWYKIRFAIFCRRKSCMLLYFVIR